MISVGRSGRPPSLPATLALAFLTAVAALVAAPASAAPQSPCDTASTTRAITDCAIEELEGAGKRVDSLVAAISRKYGRGYARKLRAVQRSWQQYVDGHCELEGESVRGGTIYVAHVTQCATDLTNDRIGLLRERLCTNPEQPCPPWARPTRRARGKGS